MVNSLYENPDARRQVYTDYNQTEEVLRNELRPAQTAIEIPDSWDLREDDYNPAGDDPHMVFTDVKGGYHKLANESDIADVKARMDNKVEKTSSYYPSFNDMIQSGFYIVHGDTTNSPTGNTGPWSLLVSAPGNYNGTTPGGCMQIAIRYTSSNVYIRWYGSTSGWTSWKTLISL